MGRNASECRAGLESEGAVAEPSTKGRRPSRVGQSPHLTEAPDPAAGVMATARVEGSLCNVRGPIGRRRATGGERRIRRRAGRESDRPIVPVKPLIPAEGRGLTSGVLARDATVTGDWR